MKGVVALQIVDMRNPELSKDFTQDRVGVTSRKSQKGGVRDPLDFLDFWGLKELGELTLGITNLRNPIYFFEQRLWSHQLIMWTRVEPCTSAYMHESKEGPIDKHLCV
jgi:hypothetical protein